VTPEELTAEAERFLTWLREQPQALEILGPLQLWFVLVDQEAGTQTSGLMIDAGTAPSDLQTVQREGINVLANALRIVLEGMAPEDRQIALVVIRDVILQLIPRPTPDKKGALPCANCGGPASTPIAHFVIVRGVLVCSECLSTMGLAARRRSAH
jgi:hypothetical protein